MKKYAFIAILFTAMSSQFTFACDESCAREKAQTEHNAKFPSYLTWKFCENTATDFMTSAVNSLKSYQNKHLSTKYKGPMKNIRNFVNQRKEWLLECDGYLQATSKGRIFTDDKTTKAIFASMDTISGELKALIAGSTYTSDDGSNDNSVINDKFEALFTRVDNHKNLLHLRGKLVVR
ncbi:MAG: hypothetical protein COA42_14455 [Alteromonadaceae bacterium]|nr:MAG: hypothetical protein COA42_14455 [Alteromonadaceae bacterium]